MVKVGLYKSKATGLRYVVTTAQDGEVHFHRFGGNVPTSMDAVGFGQQFVRIGT